jgi:hypothetical protein
MLHKLFLHSVGLISVSILVLTLPGWKPAAVPHPFSPESSTSLPQQARTPISALIGADQAAYHAQSAGGGYHLENPAHGLSASFTEQVVQVEASQYTWKLALSSWGYGDTQVPVKAARPEYKANRVTYMRGDVREWYLNGPFGLEQGFTLDRPPASNPTGGPLTLSLTLGGNLRAIVVDSGQGLVLSDPGGADVLLYAGLSAFDAVGQGLPARLELSGKALLLQVNDAGASYPLTIDPFVQKARLTASDKHAQDNFGNSVSISGDVIVVGVPNSDPGGTTNAGASYVFVKPSGLWSGNLTQTARLTASDKAASDEFGRSVSISGDVIVIGARKADPGGVSSAGAAYVFVKPGGGWVNMTQTAKLTASDKAVGDYFGHSVAVDGSLIVVGASNADIGGLTNAGAAYVFIKPGGGWIGNHTQTAKLTAAGNSANDYFGQSVAVRSNVVVVGAYQAWVGGFTAAGSAYIYQQPGGGWANTTQTATLTASDAALADLFGYSVAIDNNVIVVGATWVVLGGIDNAGAAYIFVKPGTSWLSMTQTAKLTASDRALNDALGTSVAIDGDVVVAGAPFSDTGGLTDAGAAYVFIKPASGWIDNNETAKLAASNKKGGDNFGASLTLSGDVIVVGATQTDTSTSINSGSAYIFINNRQANMRSVGTYDGWILESSESSNMGGSINTIDTTMRLGDDSSDRQYRSILLFNTASLPDNAVITSIVLKIKKQGLVGTDPFTTHQGLLVDIRKPYFGIALGLAASDFQALASKNSVGTFGTTPSAGWYSVTLNSTARPYINKTGTTQFRLRFQKDDNDDMGADYLKFYSGNFTTSTSRPLLIIQYYVP